MQRQNWSRRDVLKTSTAPCGGHDVRATCGGGGGAPPQERANPNAVRLFQSLFFSVEGQQLLVDNFAHRSFHSQIKEKPGRQPLSAIKLLKSDPADVLAQSEDITARDARLFKV